MRSTSTEEGGKCFRGGYVASSKDAVRIGHFVLGNYRWRLCIFITRCYFTLTEWKGFHCQSNVHSLQTADPFQSNFLPPFEWKTLNEVVVLRYHCLWNCLWLVDCIRCSPSLEHPQRKWSWCHFCIRTFPHCIIRRLFILTPPLPQCWCSNAILLPINPWHCSSMYGPLGGHLDCATVAIPLDQHFCCPIPSHLNDCCFDRASVWPHSFQNPGLFVVRFSTYCILKVANCIFERLASSTVTWTNPSSVSTSTIAVAVMSRLWPSSSCSFRTRQWTFKVGAAAAAAAGDNGEMSGRIVSCQTNVVVCMLRTKRSGGLLRFTSTTRYFSGPIASRRCILAYWKMILWFALVNAGRF